MPPSAERGVPILMYHRLFAIEAELSGWPKGITRHWLSVGAFERQMRALANDGYHAVSLAAVLSGGAAAAGAKPIVITFDDGWASDAQYARPILERLAWPSEHFVTVGWIGGRRYVSWEDIDRIAASGGAIQSHSVTHRDFDRLSEPEIRDELELSKARLEERVGRPVHGLALPGGTGQGRMVAAVARALGYRAICSSRVGLNPPGTDPFALRRIPVTREMTPQTLLRYVSGGSDLERLALLRETLRVTRTLVPRPMYESLRELVLR